MPDTKPETAPVKVSTLTQLVKATDQALEAEGVEQEIRFRVMNRLIYGTPNPRGLT
jgi:hypothetical protein